MSRAAFHRAPRAFGSRGGLEAGGGVGGVRMIWGGGSSAFLVNSFYNQMTRGHWIVLLKKTTLNEYYKLQLRNND